MGKAEAMASDSYMALVRAFPLRPIRSDAELASAIAAIDAASDARPRDAGRQDYILVLAGLIREYEEATDPIPDHDPADYLRDLMEANDLSQVALAAETDVAVSTVSEILSGRRAMSRKAIHAFAERFKVEHGLFMAKPKTSAGKAHAVAEPGEVGATLDPPLPSKAVAKAKKSPPKSGSLTAKPSARPRKGASKG